MNISQLLTKLKALIYSKSETDSLLGGKANSSHTHTKSQITDFPSLATVATSGSYSDLSNKPTIPSKVSQLSNDSGFITSSGSCNYANYSGYVQGKRATGSYVNEVKYGNALVTTSHTSFGAIWNAPTKNYRVACATYPSSNDEVYLCYSITNDNVSSSTNTTNKIITWNAGTGILSATGFSGPLTGNVTGNCSGSAGSVAWTNVSGKPSTFTPSSHIHTTMEGTYSGNGGKQGPGYYGKNRVGFLMSNETVNGDSDYKNWLYMDNYSADDVGGATAIGVDRMHAKAFIMQSSAARSAWSESAELLSSRHLGTAMGTASFKIIRNGISSPGWQASGTSSSVLQVCTTDNTEPSICFHRSGYSHVVLGEQSGELVIHSEGGTKYRINYDGNTTLNGYRIYVG